MTASRARRVVAALLISVALSTWSIAPSWSRSLTFDGTWSALDAPGAPSARCNFAAVYDVVNERYIVFAGQYVDHEGAYLLFNQVWTLSLPLLGTPAWEQLTVQGNPPGERHAPQWGYDPARNRVLVFGGYGRHHPGDPYTYLNDVWELKLNSAPTWKELHPIGTPPSGRLAGSAVYDVLRQRFVGFGGTVGVPVDTWQLDLSGSDEWSTVETDSLSPNGGYGMATVFDPVKYRLISFGGSTSDQYFGVHNNTWQLDLSQDTPVWNQLDPGGRLPSARRSLGSIYDPLRARMVIVGGWDAGPGLDAFLNDTWALSLRGDLQWNELDPAGTLPPGRDAMAATYDPLHDRLVMFGGWGGDVMLDDTQFLDWGGLGQSASLSATSDAQPNVVSVAWDVQNATGPHAGVYRRQEGTEWTSLGAVQGDVSGAVSFQDHSVTPGGRYGYKLVVSSERGDEVGGEVWVDVPASAGVTPKSSHEFALSRVAPNPAAERFTVAFTLPSAAPARLELIDLTGRRVASRDVGALGAGDHRIEMTGMRRLPPGMYFLKLSQAGRTVSTRVVLQGR